MRSKGVDGVAGKEKAGLSVQGQPIEGQGTPYAFCTHAVDYRFKRFKEEWEARQWGRINGLVFDGGMSEAFYARISKFNQLNP
jgi:hypothetical protein